MRREKSQGPVVTYRPDPVTGELVAVATVAPVREKITVRPGAVFGAWEPISESWINDAALTLSQATAIACRMSGEVMHYGVGQPGPLNRAEIFAVRAMMREGSE